jgi:chemotaxis protein methyltransferase WspC
MKAKPSSPSVKNFLEQTLGLEVQSVGGDLLQRAASKRMESLGIADVEEYLNRLYGMPEEQQALIEQVVVLETWFFRNHAAFEFLGRHIQEQWLPVARTRALRLATIPCATGEEPYSLAITLRESGLQPQQFQIDAFDISQRALEIAKAGIYRLESFRNETSRAYRERYFSPRGSSGKEFEISAEIRGRVSFSQGNLLDSKLMAGSLPYDFVFCRNVLIYLTVSARQTAAANLARLLSDKGLLFVGHAERALLQFPDTPPEFMQIAEANVFACRKTSHANAMIKPTPLIAAPPQMPAWMALPTVPAKAAPPLPPLPKHHAKPAPVQAAEPVDWLRQAQTLADQGMLPEALVDCQQYIAAHPSSAPAQFLAGLIYQGLGESAKAEEHFHKALYLQPDHAEALHHLLLLAQQRGDHSAAARLRQRLQRVRERG